MLLDPARLVTFIEHFDTGKLWHVVLLLVGEMFIFELLG